MASNGSESESTLPRRGPKPIPTHELRWRCDPAVFDFESTKEVEPESGVIGQNEAVEALKFGLLTRAPGQNIFVRGLTGTGRMTLVHRLLQELPMACARTWDRCYVHNFKQPDRPLLLNLPRGKGRLFRSRMEQFARFVSTDLAMALQSDAMRQRQKALERQTQQEIDKISGPFTASLEKAGLALVNVQAGKVVHSMIAPKVEGEPIAPEEYEQLVQQGKIPKEDWDHFLKNRETYQNQLESVAIEVNRVRRVHEDKVRQLFEGETRVMLKESLRGLREELPDEKVARFLDELIDDFVEHRLPHLGEAESFLALYEVNLVREHESGESCPVVIETLPTLTNLFGFVDRAFTPGGSGHSDHRMIRAGSLLRADGGFLILEAKDVLSEPAAWQALLRTLRTGRLEIVPPEIPYFMLGQSIKPEPISLDVKVILVGEADLFYLLDQYERDFTNLFKVLVDFDTVIPRTAENIRRYAGVIARIAHDESMLAFDRGAVAALLEHSSRIAARPERLTARFGRVSDIAREANHLALMRADSQVRGDDVRLAVQRGKSRADLPSRRFRELLTQGTIRVQTRGKVVGQINGLAVMQAGNLTYGFPSRITATIGAGSSGVINIERESALSGAIHTKGFYILGGLLRHLLSADHPLAFSASIAFEQSYGGIDGDSASGAEICCLISALTGVPIDQQLAMTGAIDQFGNIQAIGAVNEKIEGFFDVCHDMGLTGEQGVLIPSANVGDLMLRHDVLQACDEGRFHVYAVESIFEALELLTQTEPGCCDEEGNFPEGTLFEIASDRAWEFWVKASMRPELRQVEDATETDEDEGEEPSPLPTPLGDAGRGDSDKRS
ncbi:MAG: ATP-binding protein [Planctomycetota bacterium]